MDHTMQRREDGHTYDVLCAHPAGPKGKKTRETHLDDGLVLPLWGQPIASATNEKQRSGHSVNRAKKKKLRKRAANLRCLVELDEFAASIVEIPPASEYEKFFFSKDKQSISVQFPEREFMENEAQTNEVETADAVCSVPEDRSHVLPGTSLTNEWDPSRLEAFLHNVYTPVLAMLEEKHQTSQFQRPVGGDLPAWFSGFKTFPTPFHDHISAMWSILGVASFKNRANYIAVAYSRNETEEIEKSGDGETTWGFGDGLVVVWDISQEVNEKQVQEVEPIRWLICQNHPSVLSVFPSTPNLVFVGTREGSICCWDISEVDALHIPFDGVMTLHCFSFAVLYSPMIARKAYISFRFPFASQERTHFNVECESLFDFQPTQLMEGRSASMDIRSYASPFPPIRFIQFQSQTIGIDPVGLDLYL
jgi:hypothetical protein